MEHGVFAERLYETGMTSPQSHPSTEQLAAFDRGELGAEEWATLEQHLASCAECCQRLEGFSVDSLAHRLREAASSPHIDGSPTPMGSGPLEVPTSLANHPRYRIVSALGAGGMGVVFRAEHRLMERTVALKVIRPALLDRPGSIDRFRHEVKAAARLVHPNIVVAYDAEQAGDVHFLVMEYVEGASLDRVLKDRGPLPITEACDAVRQAALGLQHAHEHRMVHRDIKPGNLIRVVDGRVKVLDFGLSRFISEEAGAESALTSSSAVVGTPDYIAPEQAADPRSADIRADIYSLGCTLFHLLTGRPPFPRGTAMQKLIAHREQAPPSLISLRPDVPEGLARVVERMLAKNPEQRYQTPGEAAEALGPWITGSVTPLSPDTPTLLEIPGARRGLRRWWRVAGAAAAACVVLGLATILASNWRGKTRDSGPQVALEEKEKGSTSPVPAEAPPAAQPGPPASTPSVPPVKQMPPTLRITSRFPDFHKGGIAADGRRDAAIAWFDANNREGLNSELAKRWAKGLTGATTAEEDIHLKLGPGLLKSKKVTFLSAFGDGLFVFELTPEEAKPTGIAANGSQVRGVRHTEPRRRDYELANLTIKDEVGPLGLPHLNCALEYRRLAKPGGRVILRLYYRVDQPQVAYFDLGEGPKPPSGKLAFMGNWPVPRQETTKGPIVFFTEICSQVEPGKYDNLTIVSNTVAALVSVDAKTDPPGNPGGKPTGSKAE
jgi:serine/threonine protein kinase